MRQTFEMNANEEHFLLSLNGTWVLFDKNSSFVSSIVTWTKAFSALPLFILTQYCWRQLLFRQHLHQITSLFTFQEPPVTCTKSPSVFLSASLSWTIDTFCGVKLALNQLICAFYPRICCSPIDLFRLKANTLHKIHMKLIPEKYFRHLHPALDSLCTLIVNSRVKSHKFPRNPSHKLQPTLTPSSKSIILPLGPFVDTGTIMYSP